MHPSSDLRGSHGKTAQNSAVSAGANALELSRQVSCAIESEINMGGAASPDITVVVPTFREVDNLPLLVPRIFAALDSAGLRGEVVIVDDNSQDGTIEVCEELAAQFPLKLETRTNERGLSTAVIHGFERASGKILVCMDADLSHPPEQIPELVQRLTADEADFVIGSRYVRGGSTDGDWGFFRRLNSKIATWLARPLTRSSDPMAGFFALKSEKFRNAEKLDPIGYKIGLELLVKCHCRKVKEVPIHFRDRVHGESKLNLKEQLNYVRHLSRLMEFRFAHLARSARFGLVGLSGMAIDLACFAVAIHILEFPTSLSRAAAIWMAMSWNFQLNRTFTFRSAKNGTWIRQYGQFCLSCLLGGLMNWTTSIVLTSTSTFFAEHELLAASIGVATGFGMNYVLASEWVFREPVRD